MPKILFLDETGDHSLSEIDPQYPLFGLCGVILDHEYHDTSATERLDTFKVKLFGTRDIVLHTADFTRNKCGFEAMAKDRFRCEFFRELQSLVADINFKIVACVIRKQDHLERYGLNALDPYILSLSILVERFIFECGSAGGTIIAESRGPTLNHALELAFFDLKIRGTDYVRAARVQRRIHNFGIRDKKDNITGLQLADVIATPIGRHLSGKTTYPSYCGDFFASIKPKFRQNYQGKIDGIGLVVLPK